MAKDYVASEETITREKFDEIVATGFTSLELKNCEFSIKDLHDALNSQQHSVTSLNIKVSNTYDPQKGFTLASTRLSKNDAEYITRIINNNPQISILALEYHQGQPAKSTEVSFVEDDALKALLQFLKTNETIRELSLAGNFFNAENANLLQGVLSNNQTLTSLDLSECNALDFMEKFRDGLTPTTRLTSLHLRNIGFFEETKTITEVLARIPNLQTLFIEDSYADTEDAIEILRALKSNTSLRWLSMGGANNTIDMRVDQALADLVRNNISLKYLRFGSIDKEGNQALTEFTAALATNDTLEELNLSYGFLGDDFLKAITRINVKVLNIEDTEITAEGLRNLIGKAPKLEKLYVSPEILEELEGKMESLGELGGKICTLQRYTQQPVHLSQDYMDLLDSQEQAELRSSQKRGRDSDDEDDRPTQRSHVEREISRQTSYTDSGIATLEDKDRDPTYRPHIEETEEEQGSSSARTHVGRLADQNRQRRSATR